MAKPVTLWSASFTTAPEVADFLAEALSEDAVSMTVMAPPRTRKAEVEGIFDVPPDAAALQTRLAILSSLRNIKAPQLTIKELPKLDWLKKVSEDFPPLPIARWVVFGAQHKAKAAKHRRIPLQIDATSAFGTGEHPTTRGCMLMLDWVLKCNRLKKDSYNSPPLEGGVRGGVYKKILLHPHPSPPRKGEGMPRLIGQKSSPSMLDMGCGSGILAMAYVKATHGKAVGVDLDMDSVEIAKGNIRANGLRPHMRVELGNGYQSPLVRDNKPYDLIMANIFAGPLCKMAYSLKQHLKPNGVVILSGLLNHQANRVIAAHRMQGLHLIRHMKLGEWSVLALTLSSQAE